MISRRRLVSLAVALAVAVPAVIGAKPVLAADPPLGFAAASMKQVLEAAGAAFTTKTGTAVTFSFAASGALAKQLQAGAPADLFITADLKWMDWAGEHDLIAGDSRTILAGNALVLVAAAGSGTTVDLTDPAALTQALGSEGRLAMGDPASVPAGAYGQAALDKLGLTAAVADKLALAESVRAALALVARGEAPLGIVYATDAAVEPGVAVAATFPDSSHAPIVYPAAVTLAADTPAAAEFLAFLVSADGQAIFAKADFLPPPAP